MTDAPGTVPAAPAILTQGSEAEEQFARLAEHARTTSPHDRVKVRLLGQLYYPTGNAYRHWRGVSFRLALEPQVEVGRALMEALGVALHAISVLGPEQVCHVLRQAVQAALPLSPVAVETDVQDSTHEDPAHG